MIELRGITKRYSNSDTSVLALADISTEIAKGELVAIVGPSGCGKSTLLKLLIGVVPQSSGEILLDGVPISGPRQDVGVVFQSPVLFAWRSVLENVLLPAVVQRLPREAARARALELLSLVGLSGFSKSYPWQLSGGMQQRVSIARALLHRPSLLLMDEPFGALDAMTRETMNLELQRIWMGARQTILFITHSIPEAIFLADRVLVMAPRPGRFIDDVRIDLPRPRSLAMMTTPRFGDYVRSVREHFGSIGALDA